jgi:hypothetical protein
MTLEVELPRPPLKGDTMSLPTTLGKGRMGNGDRLSLMDFLLEILGRRTLILFCGESLLFP